MLKGTPSEGGKKNYSLVRIHRKEIVALLNQDTSHAQKVLDEMAVPTYLHWNPLIVRFFWQRYEMILRMAPPDEHDHVLEFGCGLGIFLPTLCAYTKHVYAIDLIPSFAKILCQQRRLDVKFLERPEDVPDRQLDIVIAADVLEHVEKPLDLFSLFRTKIKPGGRLIMSGPTENFIYKIGRVLAGFGDKGEYHKNNIMNLEKIAKDAGFILEEKTTLPFRIQPYLFHILAFRNPGQAIDQ